MECGSSSGRGKASDPTATLGDVLDNNATIDLTCPNPDCGHRWSATLGELRKGPTKCPACGLELDTMEFAKGMDDAEKKLKGFGRGIG